MDLREENSETQQKQKQQQKQKNGIQQSNMASQQKEMGVSAYEKQKQVATDILTSADNGDLVLFKKTIEAIKEMGMTDLKETLAGFKDAHKRSPLHFAAAKGRENVIKFIVDAAPETVNLVDVVGATPLVYAAKENQFAAVQLLLANGADPNVAQENGTTALHEAAANGSIETCKLLLAHSADLEATAQFGTALHFAVSENQEETVEFLIQHGANVNKANPKGVTPLMLTGVLNKPALAKQLLVAQADLTHSIMGGLTALHISAEAGSIDLVKEFLEHRAEDSAIIANTKTEVGATPLQHAAGKGHHEIVTLLKPLTKGFEDADVDALMADEKIRLEQFYENAAQYMPEPEQQPEKPQTPEDAIRGELVPEEDIVVPEAVELDEATLAKAMALKEEGNKAYVAKEFATAVQKYTEAIALSPADAVLFSNRCAAYLGAGDAVKALHDVRISKKLKPEWAKALFREGQCLEALNLFEEAAFAMWSAIQLAPKDALLEKRFQECVARGRAYHQSQVAAADASKA